MGAGNSRRAAARQLRPGQRGAVRLCRIGRCEHERVRLLAFLRTELSKPLDRAAERELRPAEALDEVAAPREAERLERLQLSVDRAVAADDPLAAHAVAGDDALPLEQQLRQSPSIRDLSGVRPRTWLEETCRLRPTALCGGDPGRAAAREAARAALRARDAVATAGAEGRPGVVRHLAGPNEIPQCGKRLLGLEPRRRQ